MWFIKVYKSSFAGVAEKLNSFYKLLKPETLIIVTLKLKETFHSVKKALSDACELALN